MSRVPFQIVDENFYECVDTSKEIFWMYNDIASNWGIVHNIDFEHVDYDKYIMCEIVEERLKSPDLQRIVDIVNQGCFTALSCYVLNLMDEDLRDSNVIILIDDLLADTRIDSMKFEKELLIIMHDALNQELTYKIDSNKYWTEFPAGKRFYDKLKGVYVKYVIGYYQSMIEIARTDIYYN